jgi:hypothetical protein
MSLLPISFGPFDAILSRGYEIPPDVPGSIHWLSTKRHEAGIGFCPDGDAVAGPKDE